MGTRRRGMRTRTLVVVGTGAAAVAYLFDPRRGRARRERVRTTIRTVATGPVLEPAAPLPRNLAPGRPFPPTPAEEVRPIPAASPPASSEDRTSGAPAAAADDTDIVRSVRTSLEERRDLGTDDLVVDVVNGVVYLSGSLHDQQTFGEVVDLTGQVPGVRRVQSLLHLPNSEVVSRVLSGRRPDQGR
jgi:BON domain